MRASADKKKTLLTLLAQSIILVATAYTAVTGFLYGAGSSQSGDNMIGVGYFKAFTMDSNILSGICAFLIVCCILNNLLQKKDDAPVWMIIFQHMTATGLFLTAVTVIFFLAPMDAMNGKTYFGMFKDDLFVFHLLNPLLAIISFVVLQGKYRMKRKDCLWAMLPLMIYAIVYFMQVVVLKNWDDFYGFSFGGRYYLIPAVVIVMFMLVDLLARLLAWMNGRVQDRSRN